MKLKTIFMVISMGVVLFSFSSAQVPQMINYQGKLTKASGAPMDTTIQMIFTIYADSGGVTSLWTETQAGVKVEKGVFNVLLGSVVPIDYSVFDGTTRYLGVQVGADPEITPRKAMVSVAYAYRTAVGDNDWTLRITDTADTTLISGGAWGIARYGNVLLGNADSTHVNLGVACTTGSSEDHKYCTVSGGYDNDSRGDYSTVGGGWNNDATGDYSTVAGGRHNTASSYDATVGGGYHNTASSYWTTVAGGGNNTASALRSTVSGGYDNTASGQDATIPGGYNNTAGGDYSFAAGQSVQLTSNADYTLGFGNNFTSSASHAVIFHDTDIPIKVGIGTTSPQERLDVAGIAQMTGFKMPTSPSNGYVLTSDASGVGTWQAAGTMGGSGAANYVPKFTAATTLGNSIIYENSSNIGIGTTTPNEQLEITGNLRLPVTTSTTGIIKMGANRFIHNYGTANTFVGVDAGNLSMTGSNNTANGSGTLSSNTTGSANNASGSYALFYNTSGSWNSANGAVALYHNTIGSTNTANGFNALYWNTEGGANTANGYSALYSNTTGYHNTASGSMSLYKNTTGYENTANGPDALHENTTGYWNTGDGSNALFSNTTGVNNTAVGGAALVSNTTGMGNTALGYWADVSSGSLTNATAIGYYATVDASNKVRIGNTLVTSIGGSVGWTTFSDGRYKKSVSQNVPGLAFIGKLKPVTFTRDVEAMDAVLRPPRQSREGQSQDDLKLSAEEIAAKQAKSQIVYTGFIAQEVEQAAREVGYDFSGVDAPKSEQGMYGLRYAEFVVPLVKAVQEQQQLIQEQQQSIQEQRQIIQDLQKRIEELERK